MCCNATGYDLSYSVTKDGVYFAANNHINSDGSFCSIIVNTKPGDSGHYQCIAKNSAGRVSSRVANILVLGMCIHMYIYDYISTVVCELINL